MQELNKVLWRVRDLLWLVLSSAGIIFPEFFRLDLAEKLKVNTTMDVSACSERSDICFDGKAMLSSDVGCQ